MIKQREKNWHVIYTAPRAEKKVYQRLLEQGIESYLPLHKAERQWSDRKTIVELPLFTSYVFVKNSVKEHLKILQTPGVSHFVRYLGKPAQVRQSEIEGIMKFLENSAGHSIIFEYDDEVTIVRGPLSGHSGRIERIGREMIRVRIEQLGMSVVAQLHKSMARKAS